jgi:hypothetical protein
MSHIDYSALRPNIKNDRWSTLATITYAITAASLFISLLVLGAVLYSLSLAGIVFLVPSVIVSSLCILASRKFFRRVSPARIDDLVAFAAMNNLMIQFNPLVNDLSSAVRILLKYAPLYPARPWPYTVDLQLSGLYHSYSITLYNISLDPGVTTDSPIEEDVAKTSYQETEKQTSIALTIHQTSNNGGSLAARHRGVIIWKLPTISPQSLKKLQRVADWHQVDAQTNGHQLALLLPTTLPYDRKGMMKLYQLLDRIHDITTE